MFNLTYSGESTAFISTVAQSIANDTFLVQVQYIADNTINTIRGILLAATPADLPSGATVSVQPVQDDDITPNGDSVDIPATTIVNIVAF